MENTVVFEKMMSEITSKPGLTTIWSRPSFGKTTLLMQFVDKIVKASGKTGCIFSLEIVKDRYLHRWKEIDLDCGNVIVNDDIPISADTICKTVREVNAPCIIAIDYIQLLDDSLAEELKSLALELSVPILGTGQLSRAVEDNPEGRATLRDLRRKETHIILQDSDVILFLWRPHKCHREIGTATAYDFGNETEIIIAKNRWGNLGTIYTQWNEEKLCFEL